ncbi:HAD family acid phosphatase [Planococcus shenhongbingii]|uniref:Nucleotidase n=1 Tax=Planococcus shenhongbingii TaxID=3058398 RepID=A0ABT8NH66_9BACL|nr:MULTISPECIES: HAD family acid phosphatase [unclassified Planococcus (in: firmicutes)]MDN7246815.1 HAD family acid phosphatase [Planococcus sp. N017]WKA58828.1 HAD family acid phosphatase [Planococcus sp. N016]
MKFGFDIDDTLINLREFAFRLYQKKLGREVAIDLFHALDRVEIHELFDMSDEEGSVMWNSVLDELYYTDCPTYPGAVELLQQLDREGHEIFYITARPAKHAEKTKAWLKQQGFPVRDDQFYCGMKDAEKVHIIEELQLDYYFDDKPAVVDTLSRKTLKVMVKDQSYNRHVELPRIKQWADLNELIQNEIK